MEADQSHTKEVRPSRGGDARIGGTRVKVVKQIREGRDNFSGKDFLGETGELSPSHGKCSSSDCQWGSGAGPSGIPGYPEIGLKSRSHDF